MPNVQNLLALCLALTISTNISAHSLDKDCNPKGLRGNLGFFNQKSFWTAQIQEITQFIENKKRSYQLAVIEHRRNLADIDFNEQESRALGIKPDPEDSRFARKMANEMLADEYKYAKQDIEWGNRCVAHARYMLLNAK